MSRTLITFAAISAMMTAAPAAASIVGSFAGGSFLQSGTVTNQSGQVLTEITIDLGVDAGGGSPGGTPTYDGNGGFADGLPSGTLGNQIGTSTQFFSITWSGLSVADGDTFSFRGLDYDGYNGGSSFNDGGATLLDGAEQILLSFADGSTGTGAFLAGSPSSVNVDIFADTAAVPLPAGLPLMLFGLGALVVARRKAG
jgi:hypothetical protein